jgi:hypothetical protein
MLKRINSLKMRPNYQETNEFKEWQFNLINEHYNKLIELCKTYDLPLGAVDIASRLIFKLRYYDVIYYTVLFWIGVKVLDDVPLNFSDIANVLKWKIKISQICEIERDILSQINYHIPLEMVYNAMNIF